MNECTPFEKKKYTHFLFLNLCKMQIALVIIIVTAAVFLAVRKCIKRPANGCEDGCEGCNSACNGCKLKDHCSGEGK